jgi:holo-[acyl-carrier protein] synthase
MKTLGIGVDIINNKRIKKSITNKKFLSRIFSTNEIFNSKKTNNKTGYFSKRFAAKEAFSKALGTGFRNSLNFNDISVINDKYGKPSIKINKKLKNIINKKFKIKKVNVFLSISDEKDHSIAFVVLGKK